MQSALFYTKCLGGLFIYSSVLTRVAAPSATGEHNEIRVQSKGKHDLKKVGRRVFIRRARQRYHGVAE